MNTRQKPDDTVAEVKRLVLLEDEVRRHGISLEHEGRLLKGLCPFHDESTPSFKVYPDGHYRCYGCPAHGDVIDFVMASDQLDFKDALSKLAAYAGIEGYKSNKGGRGRSYPANDSATAQQCDEYNSCTLAQYSESKRLPLEYLRGLELTDFPFFGTPAVRMPHLDADGTVRSMLFRVALKKKPGEVDNRVRWKSGSKAVLYGLDKLQAARDVGYCVIVEGQSDCQTLWYHSEPAVGLPGAGNWKEQELSEYLKDIPIIYVVIEPDGGGQAVLKHIAKSSLRDKVRLIKLIGAKDPSDLHVSDPDAFKQAWAEAMQAAEPWADVSAEQSRVDEAEAWKVCAELAQQPDILDRVVEELNRQGLVGEARAQKLLYLAITGRYLDELVSVAIKAVSSSGKSALVDRVLGLFPKSAYYALSAMSERALAYSEEPLMHRYMVIYEAAGMAGEFGSYLMRSLLSEGRVRYETVEKTGKGLQARLIEREGPTGLIVTTTAAALHNENETRMLSLTISDTPEQTRNIMRSLARRGGRRAATPLAAEWHALQEWLAHGEHDVTIPYAEQLAELVPPAAVRMRRDFGKLLNLIRAHALLHRASRTRDNDGCIVATIADYKAVRGLVADLVADAMEATVPSTIRETVQAVADIHSKTGTTVSQAQLRAHLELDRSNVSRRVEVCLDRGYLRNLEDKKGKPHKLELGDPLPDELEILPSADVLATEADRCAVAGVSAGIKTPSPPPSNYGGNGTNGHTPTDGYKCPVAEPGQGGICHTCPAPCDYAHLYDKYASYPTMQ